MALKNEKAMGPFRSPMASQPALGIGFLDDLHENSNNKNKN